MFLKYHLFLEEINNKKLSISVQELIDSLNGKYIDIRNELGYTGKYTVIQEIFDDTEFDKILDKKKLSKSDIENTDDFQTFSENNIIYFFINKKDATNISEPKYIILQSNGKIISMKLNTSNIDFYNKLTNKTAELKTDKGVYIYTTSNSGNNWQLKNKKEDSEFKEIINKEDMDKFIDNKKIKIKFI